MSLRWCPGGGIVLADNIHLASEISARSLMSLLVFTVVLVTDYLLQLDGHVSGRTYLPVCETLRQGSQLHGIQKTTENIHVSDGLRRVVTF